MNIHLSNSFSFFSKTKRSIFIFLKPKYVLVLRLNSICSVKIWRKCDSSLALNIKKGILIWVIQYKNMYGIGKKILDIAKNIKITIFL